MPPESRFADASPGSSRGVAPFRVGIDSYSLSPLRLSPFELLDWASGHRAAGVQFSELHVPDRWKLEPPFLAELASAAEERDLYLEWGGGQHLPFDCRDWTDRDVISLNRIAAEQARAVGCDIVRSCSGGLMRWTDTAPSTDQLLGEMGRVLRATEPIFRDLGVNLSIETHFEFTTFELLRLFESCGAEPGGWLGICLDTMNLLTMLEEPVEATRRVLPWVTSTHLKDGALEVTDRGLASFPVEIGAGMVDLSAILSLLATLPRRPNLSIEDHGGRFEIPISDPDFLARFPDLTPDELERLRGLVDKNESRPAARRARPLPREEWPEHCELRVARGIDRLRELAAEITAGDEPPSSTS